MSGSRIDGDPAALVGVQLPAALATGVVTPSGIDLDGEARDQLPPDHPAWVRDAIALSRRARELLARVPPVIVRVLTIWDHRLRSIAVGGRRLSIDASGSYRLE